MLIESLTEWNKTEESNVFVRLSNGYVYKKEVNSFYYGGNRIWKVGVNTLLGKEWLKLAI